MNLFRWRKDCPESEAEKVDDGRPPIGGPYRCHRCKKGTPEWTIDPCERCEFPAPDTRWWWSRAIDWAWALWS